jgi:phosphomannomutase
VNEAEARARAAAWLRLDPDPVTRAALTALLVRVDGPSGPAREAAAAELADRFAGRLGFGTAGLRAELGPGPRRMNRLVVRQTAAGLTAWLTGRRGRPPTVVVGYDARHGSAAFAADTAAVVAAAGGRALLLPEAGPTPVLAFAVRRHAADAGVMVTASHNPPGDNGLKVYLDDGAQIVPPADGEVAALIDEVAARGEPVPLALDDDPGIVRLDHATREAYVAHVTALPLVQGGDENDRRARAALGIVHSALHGTGGALATRLLAAAGFTAVHGVPEQAEPDPDFPTTPFPDPEEPGALTRAVAEARRRGADLVLANDPDADRIGAAVPDPAAADGWRRLTGNELGALLCDHVLRHTTGDDRLVVSTFVSSPLVGALARHHGVHHVETLTGFKWIVRPALAHPRWRFVFGFEEALGFSVDADIRDKDGLSAAVVLADLVARLRAGGGTVGTALEDLSRVHGYHAARTWAVRQAGLGATDRLRNLVDAWRASPPDVLGDRKVTALTDLAAGADGFPPTDALVVTCEDGARVVVRPSGTEPKLKIYLHAVIPVDAGPEGYGAARRRGDAAVEELRRAVAASLGLEP